jgi:hypothetical protein
MLDGAEKECRDYLLLFSKKVKRGGKGALLPFACGGESAAE